MASFKKVKKLNDIKIVTNILIQICYFESISNNLRKDLQVTNLF